MGLLNPNQQSHLAISVAMKYGNSSRFSWNFAFPVTDDVVFYGVLFFFQNSHLIFVTSFCFWLKIKIVKF